MVEDEPDADPPAPPLLIFTELLIDAPGADPVLGERGEYIEIKNIGDGEADPANITMLLVDPTEKSPQVRIQVGVPFTDEERMAVERLQPIKPGDYFVFARYDSNDPRLSTLVPEGAFYDYGAFASGPTLPHVVGTARILELGYRLTADTSVTYDTVSWEGQGFGTPEEVLAFEEGLAVGLDAEAETENGNDDIGRWCVPTEEIGAIRGTPGGPTECR